MGSENILVGPPIEEIQDISFAEYLWKKMKEHPKKKVTQVDFTTGHSITIEELQRESVKCSRAMEKQGLKKGETVCLASRNCLEACVIVVGTWMAGGVLAPIDGLMKEPELEHILSLTKPTLMFCENEMVPKLQIVLHSVKIEAKFIVTDKDKTPNQIPTYKQIMKKENADNFEPPKPINSYNDVCLMLPSSGSSGLPKESAITHKNLIYQDLNMKTWTEFGKNFTFIQLSGFYWVTGILTFINSLTCGMKRILMKVPDTTSVLKALQKYKVDVGIFPPVYLVFMLQNPDFSKYNISSLKYIIVGGSPFTSSLAEAIKGKYDHGKILQVYGTTEISGPATKVDATGDVFSIGVALPGIHIKITDAKTGKALPAKEMGEIRIKSPGIMKSYVDNDEATKQSIDSDGWFCTGDLGYHDERGQVYIVDRLKELIKVRNNQVAPVEIENTIMFVPGVKDVAVAGVSKDGYNFVIVALVVKNKNENVTEKDIQTYVENNLSDYKRLTGGVFFVDALPRSTSGKLQRAMVKNLAYSLCYGT